MYKLREEEGLILDLTKIKWIFICSLRTLVNYTYIYIYTNNEGISIVIMKKLNKSLIMLFISCEVRVYFYAYVLKFIFFLLLISSRFFLNSNIGKRGKAISYKFSIKRRFIPSVKHVRNQVQSALNIIVDWQRVT